MQPRLSVIIVNYNVRHFLEHCLRSVEKAAHRVSTEIIVIDNHSLDGSVEMIRRKFSEVQLIASDKNLGFSRANNIGIEQAKGDYILLLNPDTVVQEDTFESTVAFMDKHPNAGALGVKMIDGKGRFLPESKRGLPTPEVAFYKMFGLSALFPRSPRFGKYHLSYLDKDKNHEVDVLSGAFMLLRRQTLEITGLLDETFFMYGEDIDLSYRITRAGYKNYYFADTSIIHYKGESTKKTSVNYVFVFYKAMAIFARKHYSRQKAFSLGLLIHSAIWLRASITLLGNFMRIGALMVFDGLMFFGGFLLVRHFYYLYSGKSIPPDLSMWFFMGMSLLFVITGWLRAAYDKPVSLLNFSKGMLIGGLLSLVVYALLPESMRFSRTIVLVSPVWGWAGGLALRKILAVLWPAHFRLSTRRKKRFAIVGLPHNAERVQNLLESAGFKPGFIALIYPEELDSIPQGYTTTLGQLSDACSLFHLDEVIFCAEDVSSQRIINQMTLLDGQILDFKIAPPESLFVIGSNSIHTVGELYFVLNVNAIGKASNRRNKRILDIICSLLSILLCPIWMWNVKNGWFRLREMFGVLTGSKTFVTYDPKGENIYELPPLKPGIFYPSTGLLLKTVFDRARYNMLYAKDYSMIKDLVIIWRAWAS